MSAAVPGQAPVSIPLADLSDREKLDLIGGAAQAYDYENRPRNRNWTAVPLDQVGRLLTGALRAMEFEPAAREPHAAPECDDSGDDCPAHGEPQPAPELAALREGITALARDLDASARATSPSKKSNIEAEIAIALRKLLEGK